MKIGLCSIPPAGHSSSLLCLLNSSAMSLLFKNVIQEFSKLYRKKVKIMMKISHIFFIEFLHFSHLVI
jgi:tubulin epsilon